MPKYNSRFELSVDDVELIEEALRNSKRALSAQMIAPPEEGNVNVDEVDPDSTVRKIHDLLGRLHNQKVFYRPARQTYVSG